MRKDTVLFLSEYESGNPVHDRTRRAVLDAAAAAREVLNTRWMGLDRLALYPGMVQESAAVVLVPHSTTDTLGPLSPTLLSALREIREGQLPFLATGETHGLVFLEAMANIPGHETEHTAPDAGAPEAAVTPLPDSCRPGELREVDIEMAAHPALDGVYKRHAESQEQTDIRTGLNPDYASRMEDVGFQVAGRDRHDGRPYLHILHGHSFHATAAFLPQLNSSSVAPHPLFRGLVAACGR